MTDSELEEILCDVLLGTELEDALATIPAEAAEDRDEAISIVGVSTFEQAGVLTMNNGLVLRFSDGSEFQVSLVRSR